MRVNLAVNLRNVPERPMTEREYDKFLELMTKFLNKYTESNMVSQYILPKVQLSRYILVLNALVNYSAQLIDGIEIWHQQLVFVDAPANSTNADDEIASPDKRSRELLEQDKKDQIIAFKKQQKENEVPRTSAMQITLIIKVSFSFLPEDLLAKLAVVTIEEHQLDLMMMLQEQSNFYTYFKPLDGITSDVVAELTPPPTPEPTTLAFYLANNQEDVVLEEETGIGFGTVSLLFHVQCVVTIIYSYNENYFYVLLTVRWAWDWISVVLFDRLLRSVCDESTHRHERTERLGGIAQTRKVYSHR